MAYIQFQLRRGTTQEWYDANTQLAQGEIGLNTTNNQFKIGDGETLWRDLPYGGLQGPSVLWNYRGAYDASIAYDEGDLVTYNLSLYYRLGASIGYIGSTPGTDPTKWQLTVGGSAGNGGTSGGALEGNSAGTSGGWHFSGANEYPQYMTALADAIIGVGTDFNGNVSSSNLSVIASDAIWHFNHDGNLVLPDGGYILNGDLTVYGGTGGGGTIWTNPANGCLRAELSDTGFQAYTTASHLDLEDGGLWNIGSYQNSTSIGNDQFSNQHDLSLRSGDATFITTNLRENGNHQWKFGTDAKLTLPDFGAITSPNYGFSFNKNSGKTGAPELGTDVTFATESLDSDILDGEVYMGSGYGEFRSIYNKVDSTESGLAYAGVEGFNYAQYGDVNFSGMISQTPHIDSMYTVGVNNSDQIVIGFTQNNQTLVSNDWAVTSGTLNTGYTVNGMFADTVKTFISGGTGNNSNIKLIDEQITFSVNGRNLVINTPQVPTPDDIHIYAENPAYGVTVGDSDLGSYVTVNGTINDQTVNIVTQTGGRNSDNTQWYNILANLADTSAAYNSSVLYDSYGNVYTIGGCVTSDFVTDNLFQKFNPIGNREWKKTWTTPTGIHCGSINQSARMIPAGNYGYIQDTILWTSHSSTEGISYVGRMDTQGNFTDGAGTPTNPIKIDQNNTYVSDLEPAGYGGFVYITGHHENGSGSTYPFISKIDLNEPSQSVPAYRVEIPDMAPNDSYNMFKTIAQDATFDGMFTAGFYYDGSNGYYSSIFSAWTDLGEGGLGHIGSYQVGNTLNSTVLLETVAVNNHAAYVVANYDEGYATVIKVTQTGPNTYTPQWQTRLGNMEYGAFGTGLAFDSDNNVYLMIDTMGAGLALTKLDDTDGTVVWSRRISSGSNNEGALIIGQPGNTTSSDIQVYGNLAVLTGYTYDKSNESGCFTIQYDIATHPTGTYGDFTIYDVDLGYASDALSITPLSVNVFDFTLYTSNEAMISTVSTTTGGWDETHWDMVLNQEVYSTSSLVTNTWAYGTDGSLTIPLAGKIINNNKTWTFDSVGDLAVPGQVKNAQGHRAIWSNEVPRDVSDLTDNNLLLAINSIAPDMNWDGGAAAATYSINTNADGGFSSTRWGRNSIKFDGGAGAGSSYTATLNGGAA